MFQLISSAPVSSMSAVLELIKNVLVGSEAHLLTSTSTGHTLRLRSGKYLHVHLATTVSYRPLGILLGTGFDTNTHQLMEPDVRSFGYYMASLSSYNKYLVPDSFSCWKYDDTKLQVFVFLVTSDAGSHYLILGDFINQLTTEETLGLVSIGNYNAGSSTWENNTIFPTISSSSNSTSIGKNSRGLIYLPDGSTPEQKSVIYTTDNSSLSQGQLALAMPYHTPLLGATRTPSAGIPIQPYSLVVQDATTNGHLAGFIPSVYFACNIFPDGHIISKGNRHFRVCRTHSNDNHGSVLIEVSSR